MDWGVDMRAFSPWCSSAPFAKLLAVITLAVAGCSGFDPGSINFPDNGTSGQGAGGDPPGDQADDDAGDGNADAIIANDEPGDADPPSPDLNGDPAPGGDSEDDDTVAINPDAPAPNDDDPNAGGDDGQPPAPPGDDEPSGGGGSDPNAPPPADPPDGNGNTDPPPDPDSDGDGVADANDVCPGFDDGSDADGDGTPDGCDDTPDGDPDPGLPTNEYCDAVADWDQIWTQFEDEVLVLVNEQRAAGADCGSEGSFPPVPPLAMNAALRCAARNHSVDMHVRAFFSHTNPDGDGPGERIGYAGYGFSAWGENIAWGYTTPQAVVDGWMDSPGHCHNIMRDTFTEIGVGLGPDNLWTQAFGKP
jgi:uncharacterized protein YkwD